VPASDCEVLATATTNCRVRCHVRIGASSPLGISATVFPLFFLCTQGEFSARESNLRCLSAEYCGKAVARQNRNDANVCDARGSNPDGPEVHLTANLHCLSAEYCGNAVARGCRDETTVIDSRVLSGRFVLLKMMRNATEGTELNLRGWRGWRYGLRRSPS
jgi:hypothetical protein